MRLSSLLASLLAGIACVGLAGAPALAADQASQSHEMTIQLPGGGTTRIFYTGDVAPKVTIGPGATTTGWPAPVGFGSDPAFARMERMSAEMNRRMDAMMHQVQAMSLAPFANMPQLNGAAFRNLPAGGQSYSFVSTSNGSGVACGSGTPAPRR